MSKQFNPFAQKSKTRSVSLAQGFKNYCFKDSVNKLDRLLKVSGIDDIVFESELYTKAKSLGFNLARDGKGWGLVAHIYDNKPYIDVVKILDYTKVAGRYLSADIVTDMVYDYDKTSYPIISRFKVVLNTVSRVSAINTPNGWINISEPIIYPTTEIPFQPFQHNVSGEGDIPSEFNNMLETMDYFSDQLPEEWEFIKTQYLRNMAFNSLEEASDFENDIKSGERVHAINDPDGRLGGGVASLIAGAATTDILTAQIVFLENRILKYIFKQTDTLMGKSAQQTAAEVAKVSQSVLENNSSLNAYRLDQYKRFFKKVELLMLGLGTPATITVELPLSELDDYHFKSLIQTLKVQEGQAQSQLVKNDQAPQQVPQIEQNKGE